MNTFSRFHLPSDIRISRVSARFPIWYEGSLMSCERGLQSVDLTPLDFSVLVSFFPRST